MEISEAKSIVKSIYLQSAGLAGFEVGPFSPERFVELVDQGFRNVEPNRKGLATANILRVVAMTLELAETNGVTTLGEEDVDAGREKVCPVYPFGSQSNLTEAY